MKIISILNLLFCFQFDAVNAQNSNDRQVEMQRQIESIIKARNAMIRSLLDDSNLGGLDKHFEDLLKNFDIDNIENFGTNNLNPVVGEYDWRDFDNEVIFVLKVKQIKDKPLDIKIEKGMIRIKGDVQVVSQNETKNIKKKAKVHFERSFIIPNGVDETSPEFETKSGELLIKFKKNRDKVKIKNPFKKGLKSPGQDDRRPVDKSVDDLST